MTLTSGKSVDDLTKRLAQYPSHPNAVATTPMAADGLTLIHAEPSDDNPLLPEMVPAARQLLGSLGWITGGTRPDAQFAFTALSQRVALHCTKNVWNALLRVCNYIVSTRDLGITYRECADPGAWQADVDSSLINAPNAGSFGGYVLYYPGGGPFAWNCTVPRKLTDSSGGAELVMSTIAAKAILGWRIFMREIGCQGPGPTTLRMDANAALLGTAREKVTRGMRYLSARYAMVRDAVETGEITLVKVPTTDNLADALTKPLPINLIEAYTYLMKGIPDRIVRPE